MLNDDEVQWQSSYFLLDQQHSKAGKWEATITRFNDQVIHIDLDKNGMDIQKEFTSLNTAHDWLIDQAEGRLFNINSSFDYRDLIE